MIPNKKYTIHLKLENNWWTAKCKELDASGFGETVDDAITSVRRDIISKLQYDVSILENNDNYLNICHVIDPDGKTGFTKDKKGEIVYTKGNNEKF